MHSWTRSRYVQAKVSNELQRKQDFRDRLPGVLHLLQEGVDRPVVLSKAQTIVDAGLVAPDKVLLEGTPLGVLSGLAGEEDDAVRREPGAQIEIETIDDSKEIIKIPRGCPVGKEIIVAGKGFKNLHGYGKGNLVIIPECDVPKKLNPETKKALLEYSDKLGEQTSQAERGIRGFFKRFLG